ncbi:5-formyl-3-hydroxy-2-methylpyridine 4-carboxylate 5-dehydrogenase-like [Dysidea avara]|uniref:5-formyl-3-hydroxy-2-methylpyridine 4-carboxylate 5-dehydrogenase-like n=1 Tax=Dysidea avara TaxID=196820 RepID=UPI003330C931
MAYSDAKRPKVAVVGIGLLGLSLSGELARCGCDVRVYDKNEANLQEVHHRLEEQQSQLRSEGLLAEDDSFSVITESHLSCAVMDADFVFEAIIENLSIKNNVLKNISLMCSEDTVVCSNTLTLNLTEVFSDMDHPQRTLGVRFLLPVYFIPIVEVTAHIQTSPSAINKVENLLRFIKKESFGRTVGELPRKLTAYESRNMQLVTVGKAPDTVARPHDVVAKESPDARFRHGHC